MFEDSSDRILLLTLFVLVNNNVSILIIIRVFLINASMILACYYLIDYSFIFVSLIIYIVIATGCIIKIMSS